MLQSLVVLTEKKKKTVYHQIQTKTALLINKRAPKNIQSGDEDVRTCKLEKQLVLQTVEPFPSEVRVVMTNVEVKQWRKV